ncbi:MAG: membrane dipeptidase [Gemmatimonadaceae bacterium]
MTTRSVSYATGIAASVAACTTLLLCGASAGAQTLLTGAPPARTVRPVGMALTPLSVAPGPIVGFADLHVHQFANLAFGGQLLWGSPAGPPATALPPRLRADVLEPAMRLAGGYPNPIPAPPPQGGHDRYESWPKWTTFTAQQAHMDWLKRAVDGGLRLMVLYAVNSEAFCKVGGTAAGRSCDDMEAIDQQVMGARSLESLIDAQSGGSGKGWYRIVGSAAEARSVMESGRLAVVLGTEVPFLFGCKPGVAQCSDNNFIRAQVEALHAKGIRQVIPVHVFNNAFGGTAIASDVTAAGNLAVTGSAIETYDCGASGVQFKLGLDNAARNKVAGLLGALGLSQAAAVVAPTGGDCNARDLTAEGTILIRELMRSHILVDVDHMGLRTFTSAMGILTGAKYPIVTSHTGFIETSPSNTQEGRDKRYEANKTQGQVDQLVAAGALISVITRQGNTDEITKPSASYVPHNCSNSSRSFAQAYLYVVGQLRRAAKPGDLQAIALGSDFNGFNAQPGPRFHPTEGCMGRSSEVAAQMGTRLPYPIVTPVTGVRFDKSAMGQRVWDINEDGLAHIGLYPDFLADLKQIGVTETDLQPLFNSAEMYVRLWAAAEAYTPPKPMIASVAYPAAGQGTVTAVDAESRVPLQGTVRFADVTGRQIGSYALGTAFPLPVCVTARVAAAAMTRSAKNDPTGKREASTDAADRSDAPCGGSVHVTGYMDAGVRVNSGATARAETARAPQVAAAPPPAPKAMITSVSYPSAGQAIVTAVDVQTRAALQGAVRFSDVTGKAIGSHALGAAFALPICVPARVAAARASASAKNDPTGKSADAADRSDAPCGGTVHVDGYSEAGVMVRSG